MSQSARRALSVAFFVLPFFFAACASAQKPVRILFVGNSYTYYNDMPGMVETLYEAAGGGQMEVGLLVQAGQRLGDVAGPRLPELLRMMMGGRWDYVILQGQSTLGGGFRNGRPVIGDPDTFHEAVRTLDREIRKAGGRTVLLVTWAHARAPEQQDAITRAYAVIADEIGAALVPAGAAWSDVIKEDPNIHLHQADGSHPAQAGSYLTACTLLETLFDLDLSRAPTSFEVRELLSKGRRGRLTITIEPDLAERLRNAAAKVSSQ